MVNNPDDLDYRFSLDFERRVSRVESVSMMYTTLGIIATIV